MNKFAKLTSLLMALTLVFSICVCSAFAEESSPAETETNGIGLLAAAVAASIAASLADNVWGNAVEGAGEGVGSYYETVGQNAGDQFDAWAQGVANGNLDLKGLFSIIGEIVAKTTSTKNVEAAAQSGAEQVATEAPATVEAAATAQSQNETSDAGFFETMARAGMNALILEIIF